MKITVSGPGPNLLTFSAKDWLTDKGGVKQLKLDDKSLNWLDSGVYSIRLKNVRDAVGNYYGWDPKTNKVDDYHWEVEIQ